MKTGAFLSIRRIAAVAAAILLDAGSGLAQLNQNCTVSVLNRTVTVNPDGSWVLPNIPANFGQVKARATCVQNDITTFGESDFFTVPANGAVNLPTIKLGATTPIPTSLSIGLASISLTVPGQTLQLVVTATYPDGSTKDVTAASAGTNYTISNSSIATVSGDGLVTAVSSGTVVIQANNDGATGIASVPVVLGGSSHGGIPDDWAVGHGLNPADPLIAMEDPDRDGLANLQEFQNGTDPKNPDTDGDGLNDGDELDKYHTKPALADSDGDLIPDGVEVQTSTNPNDPASYDLKKATENSVVTPASFSLQTSTVNLVSSIQLNWKVTLIDGKTTLDLTSDPRTKYSTSDVSICSLGQQPGLIFSGPPGNCVITISQNTLIVTVSGSVIASSLTALSFLDIPGFANAVKVSGQYAYIAAGTAGLQVVDVTDHRAPKIVASLTTTGNANELRISNGTLYLATSKGLTIVDIANPLQPTILGSLSLPSVVWDVAISGTLAFIADGSSGLQIADVSNPALPKIVGSLAIPNAIAKGLDISGNFVVLAASTAGVTVVDVTNPASPNLLGRVATPGDARKVAIKDTAAFIADYPSSMQVVDFSNPANPSIVASTPDALGGKLQDIKISSIGAKTFAFGADVFFVNGVPIVDVTQPSKPAPVAILDFSKYRDDNGHGIAADAQYVYLTAERGVTDLGANEGNTRLYIGQYQQITDNGGVPPAVSITSPVASSALVQGDKITFTVNAADDVAVASVNFQVDGQQVFTTAAEPYRFNYTVPASATMLILGATALDYGNNLGVAQNVQVSVIPDPLTTMTGRVVDGGGNPVSGATVVLADIQSPLSTTTAADGSFSLASVPTIFGDIRVLAKFVNSAGATLAGFSTPAAPVRGGLTNAGTVTVLPIPLITKLSAKAMLAGSQLSLQVTGTTLAGATWALAPAAPTIDLELVSTTADGTAATLSTTAPSSAVGTFALVATNVAGNSGTTINPVNRLTIVDPNSHADTDADGFQDVIETVLGTDPADPNSVPVIPSLTETESVAFSVLNAPVNGGVQETESVPFSVLNAPVNDAGFLETASVPFSVLNAPAGTAGITEASAYFSVCNGPNCPPANTVTTANTVKSAALQSNMTTGEAQAAPPLAVDPLADSDGDGLPDWYELSIGTDPQHPDSDRDGLSDFDEISFYKTNPLDSDTDGDGFSDGDEVLFGSDPLDTSSTPMNSQVRAIAKNNTNKKFSIRQRNTNAKSISNERQSPNVSAGAVIGGFRVRRTEH